MKGKILILIVFVIMSMLVSSVAMAYETSETDIIAEGYCGVDAYWILDNNGVLTISGSGEMDDWGEYLSAPWGYNYKENITKVVIEDGIENIGDYALYVHKNLKYVEIADSVKNIGEEAFAHCYSLEDIRVGQGVENIGIGAFEHCNSLKSVTMPKSVRCIEDGAFEYCSALETVNILSETIEIGNFAFSYCYPLKSVNMPEKIKDVSIGNFAFADCLTLQSIQLSEGITAIGYGAFSGCKSLTGDIVIPASVKYIEGGLFSGCENIRSVTIKKGIIGVGHSAFSGCYNLSYAIIPGSVTYIEEYAFADCRNLKNVVIGEGVEAIYDYAFDDSDSLLNVTIPKSMKTIGFVAFSKYAPISDVYYGGTESEWEAIEMDGTNISLITAHIHCTDSKDDSTPETSENEDEFNQNIDIKLESNPEYIPETINEVTIIEKGDVYGRVLMYDADGNIARNKRVSYTLGEGVYSDTQTNEYGYATVKIPNVTESKEYVVNLEGDNISNCYIIIDVTVEPLRFKSGFTALIGSGVGVGLGFGAGGSIGELSAEAKIASIGIKGSKQVGLNFSQEYNNNKNKLVISSTANTDAVVEAKAGLFASAGAGESVGVEVSALDVSGDASYGWISTVGYEDDNFKLSDEEDIINLAKFIAVASASSNISNIVSKHIAEKLKAPVNYFENGSALTLSGGAKVATAEFGNSGVSLGGIRGQSVWENTTKTFADNSKEYNSSVNVESGVNLLNVDIGISDSTQTSLSGNSKSLFNGNLHLVAKEDESGELESLSLIGTHTDKKGILVGVEHRNIINELTYYGKNAQAVADEYDPLYDFSTGNKGYFSLGQLKKASNTLLNNNYIGKYTEYDSYTKGFELDLSAEFQLGVELGVELGISGYYNYEYEQKNGIFENGTLYVQGDNKIDSMVEEKLLTVDKIISCAKEKIKDLISPYLEQVEGWIEDAGEELEEAQEFIVKNAKATAKKTKKAVKKWKVNLKTTIEEFDFANVLAVENEYSLFSTSSVATTIGNPYIVEVSDEDGEIITDLSEQPILLELEYSLEDLEKAGVTDTTQISIIRWDDAKSVYVNMGGIVDEEAMKVSIEITKPGQYVLGVDNCEPAIVLFRQSHTGKNPVVSAYVSDMSGIEALMLYVDGTEVVNAENISDYYDYTTGLLKYETGLTNSGCYCISIYAKDTFGNEITEYYYIDVSDEIPVIYDIAELNKEISPGEMVTASVLGEEITSVLLHTLVTTALGETYQFTVDMIKENGVYTGKIPELENGSVVEIFISAHNTYGNNNESEKQGCLVVSNDKSMIDIISASDDVTIRCANISSDADIYLGVYDENGRLVMVYSQPAAETVLFENVAAGSYLKAFAWDKNYSPLCTNVVKKL